MGGLSVVPIRCPGPEGNTILLLLHAASAPATALSQVAYDVDAARIIEAPLVR